MISYIKYGPSNNMKHARISFQAQSKDEDLDIRRQAENGYLIGW